MILAFLSYLWISSGEDKKRIAPRASFIRALARGEMRNPIHRLAVVNRIALLRIGRLQADGWQECILKMLFQKRRGMRELVSSRMCLASERVDALEVEIAALCEVGERGIDE